MAAGSGRLVQFKLGDAASPEVFTRVGARATSLRINGQTVDISDNDLAGFRSLLDGGGLVSASVTIEGVYKGGVHEKLLRTKSTTGALFNGQLFFDATEKLTSLFQALNWQLSGPVDGAAGFSVQVESSGTFTIA